MVSKSSIALLLARSKPRASVGTLDGRSNWKTWERAARAYLRALGLTITHDTTSLENDDEDAAIYVLLTSCVAEGGDAAEILDGISEDDKHPGARAWAALVKRYETVRPAELQSLWAAWYSLDISQSQSAEAYIAKACTLVWTAGPILTASTSSAESTHSSISTSLSTLFRRQSRAQLYVAVVSRSIVHNQLSLHSFQQRGVYLSDCIDL